MSIVVKVPKCEVYDEENEKILEVTEDISLVMEHNLIAISRWESKFHKPYFKEEEKTTEEASYYLECMTLNKGVENYIFKCIPRSELLRITEYINDPMTGTIIKKRDEKNQKKEILSSELLYYYMFKLGIPKECENWHLNRLLTLLDVFGVKDDTGNNKNKASYSEMVARNKAINERNKARFRSKG